MVWQPLMDINAISTQAGIPERTMYMAVVVATLRARRALSTLVSAAAIGAAVSVSVPCLAGAQVTSGIALEAVTDTRAREALRVAIHDARGRGVPVDPLVAKVREGVAKQSSPDRIVSAVRLLAENMERAQRALQPVQAVEEIPAGAGALRAGVPDGMLRNLRQSWPNKTLTVPLGVLTELVANDIPAKTAAARVRELMVRGASSAQIVALGEEVRADIAAGHAPDASMELRTKGVLSLLNAQGAAAASLDTRASPRRPRPPR
jgi:hypothetical protein